MNDDRLDRAQRYYERAVFNGDTADARGIGRWIEQARAELPARPSTAMDASRG